MAKTPKKKNAKGKERKRTPMTAVEVDNASFQLDHFAKKYAVISAEMRRLKVESIKAGNKPTFDRALGYLSNAASAVERALDQAVIAGDTGKSGSAHIANAKQLIESEREMNGGERGDKK